MPASRTTSTTLRPIRKAYDTGVIPKEKLPGLPNSPENFKKGFVQDNSWWVENATRW